ncbi:MAG: hypothetical protein ACXWAV_06540 [Chthoniobacterales bacterium]
MHSPLPISVLALVALAFASATSVQASESVWSGLVMANNAAEPTPIPAELNRVQGTLQHIFGYNQFQIIGEARKTLKTGEEDWTASSKYFSLRIDSKAAKNAGYSLNLHLYQEEKLLLETEARLSKSSPLVIKGPLVGDGQLLLVVAIE